MAFIWRETGHETWQELRAETERHLQYLCAIISALKPREAEFVEKMESSCQADEQWTPTAKQLFWLRDLHTEY